MMLSTTLRLLADEVERMERLADPGCEEDVRRILASQMGFAAGWIDGLRDFDAMPGSARLELNVAGNAIERAARILDDQ